MKNRLDKQFLIHFLPSKIQRDADFLFLYRYIEYKYDENMKNDVTIGGVNTD